MDNNTSKYDNLTFKHLETLVDDDLSICNHLTKYDRPWLVNELVLFLSDDAYGVKCLTTDDAHRILNLASKFQSASWGLVFDMNNGLLDPEKVMQYTKQDRYCITASNGFRVCTQKEVDEAIVEYYGDELFEIENYPSNSLTEDEEKLMNLATWALTGRWKYFISAGYKVEYNKDKSLARNPVHYIMEIEDVLYQLCDKLDIGGEYEDLVEKTKAIKRLGKYKYPEYAQDEIKPTVPISFVITQVEKKMPFKKSSILWKCYYILKKNKGKSIKSFSTEDKKILRKGYIEITNPSNNVTKTDVEVARIKETKELCEKIRDAVNNGILPNTEFAIRIVTTLSSFDYTRCSEKQMNILLDASKKIDKIKDNEEENTRINEVVSSNNNSMVDFDEFGLAGLSDMLGQGVFGDE